MAQTLRINEVFYSIQGESTRSGRPCVFVRLSGCHLRCSYCDTEYAFKEGDTKSVEELVKKVLSFPCRYVTVTGGEPLLQARVHDLMRALCDAGCEVCLETSGACDISVCDPRVIRIVDIKTPGSGEQDRMDWANIEQLQSRDEVKFVIGDRADYDFAVEILKKYSLHEMVEAVLFSPVFVQVAGLEIAGHKGLPLETIASWILEDGLGVILQPQIHKFIWDPGMRGV